MWVLEKSVSKLEEEESRPHLIPLLMLSDVLLPKNSPPKVIPNSPKDEWENFRQENVAHMLSYREG